MKRILIAPVIAFCQRFISPAFPILVVLSLLCSNYMIQAYWKHGFRVLMGLAWIFALSSLVEKKGSCARLSLSQRNQQQNELQWWFVLFISSFKLEWWFLSSFPIKSVNGGQKEGTDMTTLFSKNQRSNRTCCNSGHEAPGPTTFLVRSWHRTDEVVTEWLGWYFFRYQAFRGCGCAPCLSRFLTWTKGFMVSEIKADGTCVVEIGGWNYGGRSQRFLKLYSSWRPWNSRDFRLCSSHLTRGKGGPTMPAISISFWWWFADKAEKALASVRDVVPDSPLSWQPMKNIISKAFWTNPRMVFLWWVGRSPIRSKTENELYLGSNVQEEVGLRMPSYFYKSSLIQKFSPSRWLFTCAGDKLTVKARLGTETWFASTIQSLASPRYEGFWQRLKKLASSTNITVKKVNARWSSSSENGGVPSTTIGVCARYIHSHQTLYAMDDFCSSSFSVFSGERMDRSTVDLIKIIKHKGGCSGWQKQI